MVLSHEFRPVCVSARSKQLFPHRSLKGVHSLCTVDADVVGTYSTFKALRPKNSAPIHGKLVNFRIHAWMEVFGAITDRERCGGCCCCSVSYVVVCALGFELPDDSRQHGEQHKMYPPLSIAHTHIHFMRPRTSSFALALTLAVTSPTTVKPSAYARELPASQAAQRMPCASAR